MIMSEIRIVKWMSGNTRKARGQEDRGGTTKNKIRKSRFRWSNQVQWRPLNIAVWLSDLIHLEDASTKVGQ